MNLQNLNLIDVFSCEDDRVKKYYDKDNFNEEIIKLDLMNQHRIQNDFLKKHNLSFLSKLYEDRNPNGDYKKYNDMLTLMNTIPVAIDGPWIAGGCILDIISDCDEIKDIDVFFRHKDMLEETSTIFYLSLGLIDAKIKSKFVSKFATNFIVDFNNNTYTIQFITHSSFPDILRLLNQFDMDPCRFGLYGPDKIVFTKKAIEILQSKIIDDITRKEIDSYMIKRMLRYSSKGYTFTDKCINSVVSSLLSNKAPLEELLLKEKGGTSIGYSPMS